MIPAEVVLLEAEEFLIVALFVLVILAVELEEFDEEELRFNGGGGLQVPFAHGEN